jgi:fatty-acyl-CoA synthase
VVIGGSACPRAVTKTFRDKYDVEVLHAWGMTEMSPLGTVCTVKPDYGDLDGEAWLDVKERAGQAPFGVEMKIVDDENRSLPWDGTTFGRLKVKGPAVAKAYFAATRTCSTRTASSTPATWRPSILMATCRSPTAPRT